MKGVGLLLIGSEQCQNDWLLSQLSSVPVVNRLVKLVWLTYDHNLPDGHRFFQIPLGVAA